MVNVAWASPITPNGIITDYVLAVFPPQGSTMTFGMGLSLSKQLDVLPYRTYGFTISACTVAGCTDSPLATFATLPDCKSCIRCFVA